MQKLSNQELFNRTLESVQHEREATLELIAYLAEIERRKLYLERGYSSLFQFCCKSLKLSEGAAARRINAMRLTQDLPQTKAKIQAGELSLSTASLTQSFFRHQNRQEKQPLNLNQKMAILNKVSSQPTIEAKKTFCQINPKFEKREVHRALSETTTRLSFVAENPLIGKLEKIKQIHSHQLKNFNLVTIVEFMAEQLLAQHDRKMAIKPKPSSKANRNNNESHLKTDKILKDQSSSEKSKLLKDQPTSGKPKFLKNSVADLVGDSSPRCDQKATGLRNASPLGSGQKATELRSASLLGSGQKATELRNASPMGSDQPTKPRSIAASKRAIIFNKFQRQCSYVDTLTKKKCDAKTFLQIDHIKPVAHGGGNELKNLRVLCANHNKFTWLQKSKC